MLHRPDGREHDRSRPTERGGGSHDTGPLGYRGLYGLEKTVLWALGILVGLSLFSKVLSGMDGRTGAITVFVLFVLVCLVATFWGGAVATRHTYDHLQNQQRRQAVRDEIDARTLRRLRGEQQAQGPRGETANRAVPRPATWIDSSDTSERYCTRCGARVRTGDRFCAACGYELGSTSA